MHAAWWGSTLTLQRRFSCHFWKDVVVMAAVQLSFTGCSSWSRNRSAVSFFKRPSWKEDLKPCSTSQQRWTLEPNLCASPPGWRTSHSSLACLEGDQCTNKKIGEACSHRAFAKLALYSAAIYKKWMDAGHTLYLYRNRRRLRMRLWDWWLSPINHPGKHDWLLQALLLLHLTADH